MKRLGLTLACFAIATPASAHCDPKIDQSVKAEFKRATYVVAASVQKETWLDEKGRPTKLAGTLTFGTIPSGLDPYLGANYDVEVLKSFKGKAPRHLTVFSENSTARTPFSKQEKVLLFLLPLWKGDKIGRAGPFVVDNCGNSSKLDTAQKTIEQLPN